MASKTTGISVRILENHLPAISTELAARAQTLVNMSALRIEADAKRTVPWITGTLRRSLHTLMPETFGLMGKGGRAADWKSGIPSRLLVDEGKPPPAGQAYVGAGVFYAKFVEFGTGRRRAKPFLLPALQREAPRFRAAMLELFRTFK